MKRLLRTTAMLCMALLCFLPCRALAMEIEYDGKCVDYTGSIYKLVVNNRNMDNLPLSPIIFNDRALVPVREIFETLGAVVGYNGETRCVEVEYDTKYVRMYINNNMAYVNGKKTAVPDNVVPKLIAQKGKGAKTMVPVRFISETIGLDVKFDYDSGTIFVESKETLDNLIAERENVSEPTQEPIEVTQEPILTTKAPVHIHMQNPTEYNSEQTQPAPKPTPIPTPKPTKRPLDERPAGNENGITGADSTTDFVMQGVDVSHWQNKIDWSKAKDDIDFAILSMGYGQDLTEQDDRQFKRNAAECEKYGIPYGVYIYSYAKDEEMAKGEADHVLRMIKDCNLSFPVYYDLEDDSQADFEPEKLGKMAEAFCEKITAAGYEVGIYANTTWWTTKLTDKAFDNPAWYKWVAQYNTKCTYKGKYTMWQYTSSGSVSGMEGDIDMNYWYGKLRK